MRPYAWCLLAVGSLHMIGATVGSRTLSGLGAATGCSPAPKVFSQVRGLETYSTRFVLAWNDRDGVPRELVLTPEVAAGLRGPYNRRNVYGAALAYGPVLAADDATRPMLAAVLRYGLTGEAPVLGELGLDPHDVHDLRIRCEALEGSDLGDLPTVIEVPLP